MRTMLDASAIVAALLDEPATPLLDAAIADGPFVAAPNLAEVIGVLHRSEPRASDAEMVARRVNAAVVPLTESLAVLAGNSKPTLDTSVCHSRIAAAWPPRRRSTRRC